jgi:hypothetical protein
MEDFIMKMFDRAIAIKANSVKGRIEQNRRLFPLEHMTDEKKKRMEADLDKRVNQLIELTEYRRQFSEGTIAIKKYTSNPEVFVPPGTWEKYLKDISENPITLTPRITGNDLGENLKD